MSIRDEMTEHETVEAPAEVEQKFKTFSVSIPVEQFEMLNKHRFLIFKDKAEFYRHVFETYANSIPEALRPPQVWFYRRLSWPYGVCWSLLIESPGEYPWPELIQSDKIQIKGGRVGV